MSDNSLSLKLPTGFGSSTGGLNLSYNFGGSTDAIANSAYSFLQNSFQAGQGFLGQSIIGTQGFLSHQTAPVLKAVGEQESTFAKLMPGMNQQLLSAAQDTRVLINDGLARTESYQNAESQMSMQVSKKSSKGGSFCFITTAVCETLKLPDNNRYLNRLRAFRDNYMLRDERFKALVDRYYECAPRYVEAINKRPDATAVYCYLFTHFILPAVDSIECGDADETLAIYCSMVAYAGAKANEF